MSNTVLVKAIENVRNIEKLVNVRSYLGSEPNYHTTKFFTENLLEIDMTKTQILMIKPVYLTLLMLNLSKTVMYEFWILVKMQKLVIWIETASLFV